MHRDSELTHPSVDGVMTQVVVTCGVRQQCPTRRGASLEVSRRNPHGEDVESGALPHRDKTLRLPWLHCGDESTPGTGSQLAVSLPPSASGQWLCFAVT